MRRRLASATYHPTSPLEDTVCEQESFAEQIVSVFAHHVDHDDMARHVASKQSSGLPFFVMSVQRVLSAVITWRNNMPRISAFYALRCNPDPVLVKLLADCPDIGFEVVDPQLLEMALELVSPSRILYSNPCLTRKVLRYANDCQIGLITIESESELMNVLSYTPDAEILIRVSVAAHLSYVSHNVDNQFGCPVEEVSDLLLTASEMRAKVVGISFNVGSGCNDASIHFKAMRVAKELIELGRNYGLAMDILCLGGGFNGTDKREFDEVSDVISSAVDSLFPRTLFPTLRLIATPGRYFASAAFSLCTSVIGKRATEAKNITNDDFDSGIGYVYQINEGVYGSFSCRMTDNCKPMCRPLVDHATPDIQIHAATVLGPNLDGKDVAQPLVHLRQLSIGEWLLWDNMGAYTIPIPDDEITQLPVYYYDQKENWYARAKCVSMSLASGFSNSFCDGASDRASEVCSDSELDMDSLVDADDLTECLQRVFLY